MTNGEIAARAWCQQLIRAAKRLHEGYPWNKRQAADAAKLVEVLTKYSEELRAGRERAEAQRLREIRA